MPKIHCLSNATMTEVFLSDCFVPVISASIPSFSDANRAGEQVSAIEKCGVELLVARQLQLGPDSIGVKYGPTAFLDCHRQNIFCANS